ncbi:MAG: hypothetical protein ACRDRX_23620 [Pseudonocardiaceae bacterium]
MSGFPLAELVFDPPVDWPIGRPVLTTTPEIDSDWGINDWGINVISVT